MNPEGLMAEALADVLMAETTLLMLVPPKMIQILP